MRKITDLIIDALKYDDYQFRINFLVGGLMSYESNDSPEKEKQCNVDLKTIVDYIDSTTFSNPEMSSYLSDIKSKILSYLSY